MKALLDELRALPLLGRGRRRVGELLATLAERLAEHPDPAAEAAVVARGAELAFFDQAPGAAARLAAAARRAPGDEATRLALLTCRALAAEGRLSAARRLLDAVDDGEETAPAAWHLAAAAARPEERRAHLEAALALLRAPADDHERFRALLELADMHQEGGDVARARAALDRALALAEAHEDAVAAALAAALHGNLLVATGLLDEALPRLARAVELAEDLDDGLTLLAEGSVLLALHLDRRDWPAARDLAARLAAIATRRHNWLGFAQAAIAAAEADRHLAGEEAAVRGLAAALLRAREAGTAAAENLLKARLAELRAASETPERLDGWLREALDTPSPTGDAPSRHD